MAADSGPYQIQPIGAGAAIVFPADRVDNHALPDGQHPPAVLGLGHGQWQPAGVLAEMLAAGKEPKHGGEHVPMHVESEVLSWCKQLMGFPPEYSGQLVSTGSMANLVGVTVTRNTSFERCFDQPEEKRVKVFDSGRGRRGEGAGCRY